MSKRDIIFEYTQRLYFPSKHAGLVIDALVGRSFFVRESIDFKKFHYIIKQKTDTTTDKLTQAESNYLTGLLTQLLLLPLAERPSDSDE